MNSTTTSTRPPRMTLPETYGYVYRLVVEHDRDPGGVQLVYEADTGHSWTEDASFYFSSPEHWWPSEVQGCRWASGRVLDIGCGAGRHALALAASGHEVVGLEPSPDAVAAARRLGVDARVGDLADLPADLGTFDTFLLLGSGLELFGAVPDPQAVLRSLAALANPGARIVGNMVLPPPDVPSGTAARQERYRMRVEHGDVRTEWSDWDTIALLRPDDLAALAARSPWTLERIERSAVTAWRAPGTAAQHGDAAPEAYLALLRLTR